MTSTATPVSVLVTDGEQRAALAVVRSLGRAGYAVHVCSPHTRSLAGVSRYALSQHRICDPLTEPARFSAELKRLASSVAAAVIVPVSEAAILATLGCRAAFGQAIVPFPALEPFRQANDKAHVTRIATELGIPVPAQRVLASAAERSCLNATTLRFPLVVKPARSVIGSENGRSKSGVAYARDREQLDVALDRLVPDAYPVLLQERINGPGVGAFLLRWNGAVLASFCHHRIREKPPSGGVSVYAESIPPDDGLLRAAGALLRALDWNGVAMVEFKRDAETGQPYLMEINGRFWGSLQLAIDAGVDFPALLVAAALGEAPDVVRAYRAGVRSRWFWGDVDHLLARLRRTPSDLALPPGAPGKARAVIDFLAAFRPGARGATLRVDDPAPAFLEAVEWLRSR